MISVIRHTGLLVLGLLILTGVACSDTAEPISYEEWMRRSDERKLKAGLPVRTRTPMPVVMSTPIPDVKSYTNKVDANLKKYGNFLERFNSGNEKLGSSFKTTRTDDDLLKLYKRAIKHQEDSLETFEAIEKEFRLLTPPVKFREFHILTSSTYREMVLALQGFVNYYTVIVNQGYTPEDIGQRASSRLKSVNENMQRVSYMYGDLFGNQ